MPNSLRQVNDFWKNLSKGTKKTIYFVVTTIILVSVAAAILLNIKQYDVLYSGLSSTEQSEIVSRLGELGVDFKTQSGGIILVPSKKAVSLKMQLSSEGYPKSTFSYDLFKSSSDFMSTDFDKKQYLIFQLQDRLQASIQTLSGVKKAIVNISIADEKSYVLESDKVPTTASLIIDIEPNVTLTEKQIKGIENLVAKSVPGLNNSEISIIDTDGNFLNDGIDDTQNASSDTQVDSKTSESYRARIIKLLKPMYGESNISAAVNVSVAKAQTATNESKKDNYSAEDALVNQVKDQILSSGGEVKDVTAAIVINKVLTEEENKSVAQIVAYAIGVSDDKIVVSGMDFSADNKLRKTASDTLNRKEDFLTKYKKYLPYAAGGLGGLIVIIILMVFLFGRKKNSAPMRSSQTGSGAGSAKHGDKNAARIEPQQNDEIPAIILNETRELGLKRQIKDFSATNPEIVAQLLRTWLKEENNS